MSILFPLTTIVLNFAFFPFLSFLFIRIFTLVFLQFHSFAVLIFIFALVGCLICHRFRIVSVWVLGFWRLYLLHHPLSSLYYHFDYMDQNLNQAQFTPSSLQLLFSSPTSKFMLSHLKTTAHHHKSFPEDDFAQYLNSDCDTLNQFTLIFFFHFE